MNCSGELPGSKPKAKSAATTRQAILKAAHRRFLDNSYDTVGLRDIAGDAGVDVALVSRYFGNKESLFQEVMGIGDKDEFLPDDIAITDIPAFFAKQFVQKDNVEDNEKFERVVIMLRSSSSPVAARIIKEAMLELIKPIAGKLGGETANRDASLAIAVWLGAEIMQTVMGVAPQCSNDPGIEKRLEKLFAAALLPVD